MPDGNPSIKSQFPIAMMKQLSHYLEVKIVKHMEDSKNHLISMNVQFSPSQSLLKNLDVQGFFAIIKEFSKFEYITKNVVAIHMIQEGQMSLLIIV